MRGPASQMLRVAICNYFKVSQRVGFYGTAYEAPCIWGQCKPTLEPNKVGNKWQFVHYTNYKPREAQDEPCEEADEAADAGDDNMDDDIFEESSVIYSLFRACNNR